MRPEHCGDFTVAHTATAQMGHKGHQGPFSAAARWPEAGCFVICHRRLTPSIRLVADASSSSRVHHLKSTAEMKAFFQAVKLEHQGI
jgi:hypothetical protein